MITLTSDFGLKDPYVAEMKGVILSINPGATIVDVTHNVSKFDVREGAFMLASAAPYFPDGTVHLAVVDPGVGKQRRAILIETQRALFVGPDNGVLLLAAQHQQITHIHELTNHDYMLTKVSSTFHGRDIFGPAAAYLDMGEKPSNFGPQVTDPVKPQFIEPKKQGDSLMGEVLSIDDFGNVITNIRREAIHENLEKLKIKMPGFDGELPVVQTYGKAKPGQPIVLVGSHGFLEIALNQGNAGQKYGLKEGDIVTFTAER